jgi:hypothetical protein
VPENLYEHVRANGWESALEKFRPAIAQKEAGCTLGEYIAAVKATADISPKTIETYCGSLRKIASDPLELPADGTRYDYQKVKRPSITLNCSTP